MLAVCCRWLPGVGQVVLADVDILMSLLGRTGTLQTRICLVFLMRFVGYLDVDSIALMAFLRKYLFSLIQIHLICCCLIFHLSLLLASIALPPFLLLPMMYYLDIRCSMIPISLIAYIVLLIP